MKRTLEGAGGPAAPRSTIGQSSGQGSLAADVIMEAITKGLAGLLEA